MKIWLRQHQVALVSALTRLLSSPLTALLSLLAIGIALALPATGYVLLENLRELSERNHDIQQVTLYLKREASAEEIAAIQKSLSDSRLPWHFISRETALRRLESQGFADAAAALPDNPLPDAVVIELGDLPASSVEEYAKSFARWPGVASVQVDTDWVKRFAALLRIGKMFVLLLGAVFAAGSVAVTFNTIRLQVLYHSDEIEVAELIGATDAFIQRPFHYFGALQGVLGAGVAAALVALGVHLLNIPIAEFAELSQSPFRLTLPPPLQWLGLIGIGGFLGWLGAYLSVNITLWQQRWQR